MCTGLYVGKKVSKNGNIYIGRSSDSWKCRQQLATCQSTPKTYYKNPLKIKAKESKFEYNLPNECCKYISFPVIPADRGVLINTFANEFGVCATATITTYNCQEIEKIDPFTENGLCEPIILNVIAPICKSARECVEQFSKLMIEFGSNAAETILVADKNEAWMIELYSGHQWAAIKMPEDKMAAFGNNFKIQTEYLDVSASDFMHSENLFTLPKENGLAVFDNNGNMRIAETYMGKNRLSAYSTIREYFGLKLFAPSKAGEFSPNRNFDLFFVPDEKVSIKKMFEFYRCRYEGSEFCPEENDNVDNVRLIGTEVSYCVHVTEINANLPKEMCITTWYCINNAETSVFLPYNSLVTKFAKAFTTPKNLDKLIESFPKISNNKDIRIDDRIAAVAFKKLSALCQEDRKLYSIGVRKHWNNLEEKFVNQMPKLLNKVKDLYERDNQQAIDYINSFTINMQNEVLADAKSMFDELIWYIATNIETFKYINNCDTLQFEPKNPEPFKPCFCYKEKYLVKQ